jgi:hypothetical protein
MKKALLLVAAMLLGVSPVSAQSVTDLLIGCGEVRSLNTSAQFGDFGLWVEYIVSTTRTVNTCPLTVAVQARVVNVSQSGLAETGVFSASVRRQIPVPYPGVWQTDGEHQFSVWFTTAPGSLSSFTSGMTPTKSLAEVKVRLRDPAYMCYEKGGWWDGWECILSNTPLIVDTNHDGYRLTSAAEGVLFDLDADGVSEPLAWTEADSDDAFLVMDRNGNGRIDDGTELFGNYTPGYANRRDVTTANGFEALRFLETPSYGHSAPDGTIDERDAPFSRLLLWRDRNHNGISEPEELEPLGASGLQAIHTEYKTSRKRDRHDNEFRQRAKGVWSDGEYFIYDVWLRRQ